MSMPQTDGPLASPDTARRSALTGRAACTHAFASPASPARLQDATVSSSRPSVASALHAARRHLVRASHSPRISLWAGVVTLALVCVGSIPNLWITDKAPGEGTVVKIERDTVLPGLTLVDALLGHGVPGWAAIGISKAATDLGPVLPGTVVELHGTPETGPQLAVVHRGIASSVWVVRDSVTADWMAWEVPHLWQRDHYVIAGVIVSTLDAALDELLPQATPGARAMIAGSFRAALLPRAGVLAAAPGARFVVIVDRDIATDDSSAQRFGLLRAASVRRASLTTTAIRFATPEGSDFFDPTGTRLGAVGMSGPGQSPVAGRISSGFTTHRLHPILGIVRPHLGTDYAAPYGSPVRASYPGVVRYVGRLEGYGLVVILRHGLHQETRYGHLSSVANALRVGSPVRAGQLLGAVGSSGLSTGPHLHYEVRIDGRPVDPVRAQLAAVVPEYVAAEHFGAWRDTRDSALAVLRPLLNQAVLLSGPLP
jgi:murein DD-endopeptidase MepM/ murein hydrolase activator NlpD